MFRAILLLGTTKFGGILTNTPSVSCPQSVSHVTGDMICSYFLLLIRVIALHYVIALHIMLLHYYSARNYYVNGP